MRYRRAMSPRWVLFVAAVSGFLAVGLGAFGAHGLRTRFSALEDGAKRLEWWATAAQYHLVHSVALCVVALVLAQRVTLAGKSAAFAFVLGVLVFSGSLYTMSLTGLRALGAVTPIGGLAFLVGWAALAWAALGWNTPSN